MPTDTAEPTLDGAGLLFLLRHGVSARDLARAARDAHRTGTSAEAELIAGGVLTEDGFYRALAAECGLPFLANPAVACTAQEAPLVLASGHARAASGSDHRAVAAPRGAAIRLLARHAWRGPGPDGLALTTPSRLEAAVIAATAPAVARAGAHALPDARPAASYRDEAGPAEVRAGLAAIAAVGLAAGADPAGALGAGQALLGLLFLSAMALRIAAAAERPIRQAHRLPAAAALPFYSVLVPLHREGPDVVASLLEALGGIDYPSARREILLLVEADDRLTAEALAASDLPPGARLVLCPPGLPRTKPRALNIGLSVSRGELLVVYDAEDRPDPAQLHLAAAQFAASPPDVGCLQAALAIHNAGDGWLARLFQLEYALLFDVTLPGWTRLAVPVPLGGTSNHFRRRALDACGGWDAWNVTEDADIGLRLAQAGFEVETLASTTLEEAPSTLRRWFPQRVRWLKGWMQTTVVHSRGWLRPWRGGPLARLAVITHGWGTVLSALGAPVFLAAVVGGIVDGSTLSPDRPAAVPMVAVAWVVLACGVITLVGPAIVAARRRRIAVRPVDVVLAVPYLALVSAAAWVALWELLDAPFRWNKTEHGALSAPVRSSARDPSRPRPGSAAC